MRARNLRSLRQQFPGESEYGMPILRRDMLAVTMPRVLSQYSRRVIPGSGKSLAFFLDDYRFEHVFSQPAKCMGVIKRGWESIVEPDFSVWRDRPIAEQIWAIYRTRWCGRLWQEAGIKIIPCVSWGSARSFQFAFRGIPYHPPIVALECRTPGAINWNRFVAGYERMLTDINPDAVIVYGSPRTDLARATVIAPPRLHSLPVKTRLIGQRDHG